MGILKGNVPSTDYSIAYGTPEMAREILRLYSERYKKIIIMGGHREGIITFGKRKF